MFSFHKPKVYRSSTGCCICRAKSSSSRFTDSKKYEDDFLECFQLVERRAGEICNACVLLVKRWKKLPVGSERNWRHVVDARAGPGTKSLSKFKSLKNKKKPKLRPDLVLKSSATSASPRRGADDDDSAPPAKRKKHTYRKIQRCRESSPGALSDDIPGEECLSERSEEEEEEDLERASLSPPLISAPGSPSPSEEGRRASSKRAMRGGVPSSSLQLSSFLDMSFWKREKTCCGTIFKGPHGEALVDLRLLKPCRGCPAFKSPNPSRPTTPIAAATAAGAAGQVTQGEGGAKPQTAADGSTLLVAKGDSDSSSDSGYDESSNPGLDPSQSAANKQQQQQRPVTVIKQTSAATIPEAKIN